MIPTKENITKKFKNYKDTPIEYEDIDLSIRQFMFKLNAGKNIATIYSCEGHQDNDWAYIFFSVNNKGWDIFWGKTLPELIAHLKNDLPIMNMFVVDINCNEYNQGITIHRRLNTDVLEFEDGTVLENTWEEKKKIFWKTMEEIFLKHF